MKKKKKKKKNTGSAVFNTSTLHLTLSSKILMSH